MSKTTAHDVPPDTESPGTARTELVIGATWPGRTRPLPVLVLGHGPEAVAVARELAGALVEYRDLAAAHIEERKARRAADERVRRFGVTLDFDAADLEGALE